MEKSKTSRKFLATALVAILVISTISMAIPVMARDRGVRDYDVTAKRIAIAPSERNFIEIAPGDIIIDGNPDDWEGIPPIVSDPANDTVFGFCDDDILDVYVTDDGTNLYFMVELGCIPADTWLYLDMDVDQNISTGYNTNTDIEDGYLSSHDTGIDYTIKVDPYDGYADLYAVNETLGHSYIASCSIGLGTVVEVAVPINEFEFETLPFNMDFQTYYDDPMDEAPDTGYVTYPYVNTEPVADFTGTPRSGPEPLTVNFTDASTSYDGITSWAWDFGDGATSTDQNPTYVYTTEGTYNVSLTVGEEDGDSDTETKENYITVTSENQPPVSDPNGPYSGTEGVAITFDGSASHDPDGNIVSYAWEFGDGNTGTGVSPTHTYAQNGTYTVTLTVTDNEGLTDTNTTTAAIADTEPVAGFTGTPRSGPEPLTVNFTDASTSYDGITSWAWDFGDGATSTDQNPTYVYTTEGTYNVSLTVGEEDGDSDTETKENYITVTSENQPPVSDPNGPYSEAEGVAITFDGSASHDPDGNIVSYAWEFGDGNTGTGVSPTHTYAQNGTYTVTLTVTDNEGLTDTNTTTAAIADTEPVAGFTGTPRSGPEPLTVNFTDASTSHDGITSWAWDFGDDATSTDRNPRHEYTTEGTYNVSLTVGEGDGDSDTETKENYITVTSDQLPVYNVSITSELIEQTTAPDEEASYTLTITNNGNVDDTIELNITVNEANYSSLSTDNFSLNATETVTAYLYVKDSAVGIYNTTVSAISQGNTSVFDEVTVKTNVTTVREAPTADYLEIEDACAESETYVEVPVSISNVKNGPVQSIRLTVDYDDSVLNLTNISSGDLTPNWGILQLGEDRHNVTLATFNTEDAIPDGSTGAAVLMNFSVIGSPGDTSPMNLSLVELSNPYGEIGTAPAKNGVFTVSHLGTIAGRITYACNGTGIAGVVVNLTKEGTVVYTTVTNETGYYTSTDVIPDCYFVNVSKPRFFDNSTEVTVTAGATTIVDMMLWLKGDLNNNGVSADAGDVVRMLRASVGDIPGDVRYDLNANGVIADAGDVVLLLRASVGDIVLW